MITFDRVSYNYPEAHLPALQDVSLEIEEGAFVLVAGPSGAGKSTLLRCMNGLVPHFYGGTWSGYVLVDGRDTREHEPRALAGTVGFVFQDPEAQAVVDIVEDELVFGMENLGLDPRVMRRRVEEVLDQLEIAHLRRRHLSTLSGGERQRVAIAAVLTTQPRVLVLDEPTSQLDPHTAEDVLTALQKLNADLGLTIMLSEHRLERVVQYVDQLIFCRGRDTLAAGEPQVVIGPPQTVLLTAPFAPPLAEVGRALDWQPLPLTLKAARRFVARMELPDPPPSPPSPPIPATPWWRARRPPEDDAVLTVSGLSVTLGAREVIRNLDMRVEKGEIVALMGRNGSGKTTLLRAIMGLVRPQRGAIRLGARDITRMPADERGRLAGYVPQDPRALLFHATVHEELRWMPGLDAGRDTDVDARIDDILTLLALNGHENTHPRELSVGEQQRVALATALIRDPPVLLLDEPTRGLDYLNKERLTGILHTLQSQGRAILLVTHDVELVAACADRVVLLGEGEVVTEGPTRTLLHESLIFSSQIGKLFPRHDWLTAAEALAGLGYIGEKVR